MFRHDEKIPRRGWVRLILFVIPVVLIFTGISIFAVNKWYEDNLDPLTTTFVEDVVVVIENGSSVREIGDQLKDLGVIRNSTVFSWYVGRQSDRGSLQAGTYRLNPGQSVEEIFDVIVSGDVATNLFTILPGNRLDELQSEFIEFGFSETEVAAAFNARYEHSLFDDLPVNATLEGYVFPETYEITVDSTVQEILSKSFDELDNQLTSEVRAGIKKQGLSLHEAVILASIVEKESSNVKDQSKIAQVFLSRLDQGSMLGSDVTFFYAAAITGEKPSTTLDNPYNTRVYGGLPPGPISNFNLSAIESVSSPANTDFLFFVAGDDGITYFSKTLAEHESLTAQHCIELCKLPE